METRGTDRSPVHDRVLQEDGTGPSMSYMLAGLQREDGADAGGEGEMNANETSRQLSEDAAEDDDGSSTYWEEEETLQPGTFCLWKRKIGMTMGGDMGEMRATISPTVRSKQKGADRRLRAKA